MTRTFSRWVAAMCLAGGVVVILDAAPATTEPSSKSAEELVKLMTAQNLQTFAVPDPDTPGRFVAAMLIPGSQLLVVAAQSTAPAYLHAQLVEKDYAEIYSTLHSAAVLDTKLFVQDMGCDGLPRSRHGNIDIMYERGTAQTVFDGDWKGQKMSRSAYEEKLRKADVDYSRLLTLLSQQLRTPPSHRG